MAALFELQMSRSRLYRAKYILPNDQLRDDNLRELDKGHFRLLNKGKVGCWGAGAVEVGKVAVGIRDDRQE